MEPAVAESAVLRGTAAGRALGGAARRWRHGAFSWNTGQVAVGGRAVPRRPGGRTDGAADAAQARSDGGHPAADPTPVAALASGAPAASEGRRVSACLLCGSDRFAPLFHGSDRLYRTTAKEFAVVRCGGCGLMRLDPPPTPDELRLYYPANYWFAPDQSAASRLEEVYRRL